jgi:hypothetical protein
VEGFSIRDCCCCRCCMIYWDLMSRGGDSDRMAFLFFLSLKDLPTCGFYVSAGAYITTTLRSTPLTSLRHFRVSSPAMITLFHSFGQAFTSERESSYSSPSRCRRNNPRHGRSAEKLPIGSRFVLMRLVFSRVKTMCLQCYTSSRTKIPQTEEGTVWVSFFNS